jgi:hypothetical protein
LFEGFFTLFFPLFFLLFARNRTAGRRWSQETMDAAAAAVALAQHTPTPTPTPGDFPTDSSGGSASDLFGGLQPTAMLNTSIMRDKRSASMSRTQV